MSSSGTSRACYARDGTLITNQAYQPCNSTGESVCCGTNHQGVGELNVANDVCEANGLCQNYEAFDGTNEGAKLWWRQGCTDPTWKSPNCLGNVCNTGLYQHDNAPVRSCSDGGFCCGDKGCCSMSTNVFYLPATVGAQVVVASSVISMTTGVGSASFSGARTTVLTSGATATTGGSSPIATSLGPIVQFAGGEEGAGLPMAAKIGIGVGVAVFVILLSIIAFLLFKLKRRKPADSASVDEVLSHDPHSPLTEKGPMVTYAYARNVNDEPVELDGGSLSAAELGATDRQELHGSGMPREMSSEEEIKEMAGSKPMDEKK